MSTGPCRTCDRACERSAQLLIQLRKTAAAYHEQAQHPARSFFECPDSRCLEATAAIER